MPAELIEAVAEVVGEAAVVGASSHDRGCRQVGCFLLTVIVIGLITYAIYSYTKTDTNDKLDKEPVSQRETKPELAHASGVTYRN